MTGTVDVSAVVAFASGLPNVAVAREFTILAPSGQILLTGTQYFASNISFSGESATVPDRQGKHIIVNTWLNANRNLNGFFIYC